MRRIRPIAGGARGAQAARNKMVGGVEQRARATGSENGAGRKTLGDGTRISARFMGGTDFSKARVSRPKGEPEDPCPCPTAILYQKPDPAVFDFPYSETKVSARVLDGRICSLPKAGEARWQSATHGVQLSWRPHSAFRYHHLQAFSSTNTEIYSGGRLLSKAPGPVIGAAYTVAPDKTKLVYAVCAQAGGTGVDIYKIRVVPRVAPECGLQALSTPGWVSVGSQTDWVSGCVLFNAAGTQCTYTTQDVSTVGSSNHTPRALVVLDVTPSSVTETERKTPTLDKLPEMNFYQTVNGTLVTSRREIVGLPAATFGVWEERRFGYYYSDFRGDALVWAAGYYVPDTLVTVQTTGYVIEEDTSWATGTWKERAGAGAAIQEWYRDHDPLPYYRGNVIMQFSALSGFVSLWLPINVCNIDFRVFYGENVSPADTADATSTDGGGFNAYVNHMIYLDLSIDTMVVPIVHAEFSANGLKWDRVLTTLVHLYMYGVYEGELLNGANANPGYPGWVTNPAPVTVYDYTGAQISTVATAPETKVQTHFEALMPDWLTSVLDVWSVQDGEFANLPERHAWLGDVTPLRQWLLFLVHPTWESLENPISWTSWKSSFISARGGVPPQPGTPEYNVIRSYPRAVYNSNLWTYGKPYPNP